MQKSRIVDNANFDRINNSNLSATDHGPKHCRVSIHSTISEGI